jgi:uncharacterized protein
MVHTYQYKENFIALDVESGSVHLLNELAYDAINHISSNDKSKLKDKYSQHLCDEIFIEIEELTKQGVLFSVKEYEPEDIKLFDPVCKALCLNITTGCNLRCSYCFAGAGTVKHENMRFETAKRAIDFLVKNSGTRVNLEVDFFGGEPTINFDVVKKTVAYAKTLESKHNKNFRFTLTTNAYHLTDDMIDFINDEMKNVVISMDGRKQVHDSIRRTASGEDSFEKVLANAKKLVNRRGDKEHYIRGTFTSKNLDFSNDIINLYKLGFNEVSVEPVVTSGDGRITEDDLPEIIKEYEILVDYLQNRRIEKGLNFFHFNIDFSGGPCLNKRLRGCGAGVEYFAVNPNGNIYPCHQFAGNDDFIMGNVDNCIIDQTLKDRFAACNVYTKHDCINCHAKYYCSGGCMANSYNENNDLNKPYQLECEIMKKRVELSIALSVLEEEND